MHEVNRVRLGLIGCGNFSDSLAKAVQKSQKADLIACFDINPEKSQKFRKTYGCGMENSYDSLLNRGDIDGVKQKPFRPLHRIDDHEGFSIRGFPGIPETFTVLHPTRIEGSAENHGSQFCH